MTMAAAVAVAATTSVMRLAAAAEMVTAEVRITTAATFVAVRAQWLWPGWHGHNDPPCHPPTVC